MATNLIITDLIKDRINAVSAEIKVLDTQINGLKESKAVLQKESDKFKSVLQDSCEHEKSEKVIGTYYPGGYYDKSEQNYTIECIYCGKIMGSGCIRGNYA